MIPTRSRANAVSARNTRTTTPSRRTPPRTDRSLIVVAGTRPLSVAPISGFLLTPLSLALYGVAGENGGRASWRQGACGRSSQSEGLVRPWARVAKHREVCRGELRSIVGRGGHLRGRLPYCIRAERVLASHWGWRAPRGPVIDRACGSRVLAAASSPSTHSRVDGPPPVNVWKVVPQER